MHGPTFMGNPLACRVALASLSLLATGAWQAQVAAIETGLTQGLSRLRQQDGVSDVRTISRGRRTARPRGRRSGCDQRCPRRRCGYAHSET
ncbi:MAG: aminotransferase class III-fold pyridoxal phosphate-dependent enzyme [Marmoricola sp.]